VSASASDGWSTWRAPAVAARSSVNYEIIAVSCTWPGEKIKMAQSDIIAGGSDIIVEGSDIIAKDVDAHERDDFATDLMWAAYEGDKGEVERLIRNHPDQLGRKEGHININDRAITNGTALMIAAACGHREVVRLLVTHEGGESDDNGKTALIAAAQAGYDDCVELLLMSESGNQDRYKKTALMWAAQEGYHRCVNLLACEKHMVDKNGETALMWAAKRGRAECVRLLLDEGGTQSKVGRTALMWAAYSNHADCVEPLVDREKDKETTGRCWNYSPPVTALDIAKMRRNQRILDLLE
ncbi:Ankyrin repeat protein, partial [Giardia duodenalis]